MYDHAVLHYSEIGTKSGNRRFFERVLVGNVATVLKAFPGARLNREHGRITFTLDTLSVEQQLDAIAQTARLPGVATVSAARRTAPTLEDLIAQTVELAKSHEGSLKVAAKRADKSLPFRSQDILVQVGAAIQEATGRDVKMRDPDVIYRIEVDKHRGYVFDRKTVGPGGLPSGVSGRVVSLLSGGIDSPVASYLMMLRGCTVIGLHLWNQSFSGEGVRDKVLDLGRALAPYQGRFKLHLVPFEEIQQEIIAMAPAEVRMLLYRRAMLAVANQLRRKEKAQGTILGDSVGQVASQTLPNLASVYAAGRPPLLAPLAGMRKRDIIDRAREIGTYEISIRPGEDCCGLLVPKHPATTSTPDQLAECEAAYDLPALVARCMDARETHVLGEAGSSST